MNISSNTYNFIQWCDNYCKLRKSAGSLDFLSEDDTDLDSPDTYNRVVETMANTIGADRAAIPQQLVIDTINTARQVSERKKLKSKEYRDIVGSTDPLVAGYDPATLGLIRDASKRFRSSSSPIARSEELRYGGVRPSLDSKVSREEMFQRMLHSDAGLSARGSRARMAAISAYHEKLNQIISSDVFMNLPDNLRNFDTADYMAISTMPEELQTLVPITHRTIAVARAKATNGWSVPIDADLHTDPDALAQSRLPVLQDNLFSFADMALAATPLTSAPTRMAKPVLKGGARLANSAMNYAKYGINTLGRTAHTLPGSMAMRGAPETVQAGMMFTDLPAYDYRMNSANGDGWTARNIRNRAYSRLFDPLNEVPKYPWQRKEMASQTVNRMLFNTLALSGDAAGDIMGAHNMFKSGIRNPLAYTGTAVSGAMNASGAYGIYKMLKDYVSGNDAISNENLDSFTSPWVANGGSHHTYLQGLMNRKPKYTIDPKTNTATDAVIR